MAIRDFDSKDEYLSEFRAALVSRGAEALSEAAIRRALEDAEEKFEMLLGRGKTPTAISDILGDPADRAEVVIAMRLLRLRPGSETGPRLIIYLRVLRTLAIVAPVNMVMAAFPPLVVLFCIAVGFAVCFDGLIVALVSLVSFEVSSGPFSSSERLAVGFHFLGVALAVIFFACLLTYFTRGVMFLVWRWMKWNVNFLSEEVP